MTTKSPAPFRAQEISRYVVDGIVDCGLTGQDWIVETAMKRRCRNRRTDLLPRHDQSRAMGTGRARDKHHPHRPDFEGKVVATELVNVTRKYFATGRECHGSNFPGNHRNQGRLLDGIVDLTETGSSIRANNLRINRHAAL